MIDNFSKEQEKKIAKIAFNIFREWTNKAQIIYPENDFTIIDETKLVIDLTETIYSGILNFQKLDEETQNKYKFYEYHYLLSYIRGNLNTRWIHEYINRNSADYRNFIACKALLEYLKLDKETGEKINVIYTKLLEQNTNLAELNTNIDEKDFSKQNLDLLDLENIYPEKETPIYTYLENQLKSHLVKLMEVSNMEIMPELDAFIDKDLVEDIFHQLLNKK